MVGGWKIPTIGREQRRPPSRGYLAREPAFENLGDYEIEHDEMTVEEQQQQIKKEQKKQHKDPIKLPKYQDPDKKKMMQAIKNDIVIQRIKHEIANDER